MEELAHEETQVRGAVVNELKEELTTARGSSSVGAASILSCHHSLI